MVASLAPLTDLRYEAVLVKYLIESGSNIIQISAYIKPIE